MIRLHLFNIAYILSFSNRKSTMAEAAPCSLYWRRAEINLLKWSINLFSSTGDETYSRLLSTFSEAMSLQVNISFFFRQFIT